MKKIFGLVLVLVVALVGCKQGNKVDPNAPLELTVENLAGKWVLESDTNVFWSFSGNNYSNSDGDSGTYTITGKDNILVEWYDSFLNKNESKDFPIIVYKTYMLFNNDKYIKQ